MIKFNCICFYLELFYYFCCNKICSLKQLFETKFQESFAATIKFSHFIKTTDCRWFRDNWIVPPSPQRYSPGPPIANSQFIADLRFLSPSKALLFYLNFPPRVSKTSKDSQILCPNPLC